MKSLAQSLWYDGLQVICRLLTVLLFRIRCEGRENLPASGGALLLSSHQSFFDPVLLGVGCNRQLSYVARDSLFRFAPFRWLIKSLNAIAIDREGLGMSGLKETLKRLKQQQIVVLFPEGTRTPNGQVQSLKPGFAALAKRSGVPIIPAAVVGAYEAWPRQQRFPSLGFVQVQYGPPLTPEEMQALGDRELVAEVERRIRACHEQAERLRALRRGSVVLREA
jgi:1-acyl-sn-glycerol-3-phosphate acyltransferase